MKKLILALSVFVPFAAALHAETEPDVIVYNGLLYAEMQPLADRMAARGQTVEVLWHDTQPEETRCPRILVGHSMGGNAALRQAERCAAAGRPPKVVVTIDPGRAPLYHTCPADVVCINYYDPTHPIGGQYVVGARNIRTTGHSHLALPTAAVVVNGTLAATKNF